MVRCDSPTNKERDNGLPLTVAVEVGDVLLQAA